MKKYRTVEAYKDYTTAFLDEQTKKVRDKYFWTIQLIEEIEVVPVNYLRHLENGIYEIRVRLGSNAYRVLAFFDKNRLILTINGFYKKTQKTPKSEIKRAILIREEYEKEKS